MNLEERFYTSTEVAEILGVSLRSVYRYLEEEKLIADVKTATGRHRFTKQNILDFLYPKTGQPQSSQSSNVSQQQSQPSQGASDSASQVAQPEISQAVQVATPQAQDQAMQTDGVSDEVQTEGVSQQVASESPTTDPQVTQPQADQQQTVSQTSELTEESSEKQNIADTSDSEHTDNEQIQTADDSTTMSSGQETTEEEVDWLAKFRAAAQKHREKREAELQSEQAAVQQDTPEAVEEPQVTQQTPTQPTEPRTAPVQQAEPVAQQAQSFVSSLSSDSAPQVEKPVQEQEPVKKIYYYKSSVGGLKELAQQINNSARKSNVPYAFTMNSGMSLHKLIRPFSMLHIYTSLDNKEFFEKTLGLVETSQDSAQLGVFIDTKNVLQNRQEMHGLYVVSNDQLVNDLRAYGEAELAQEFASMGSQ